MLQKGEAGTDRNVCATHEFADALANAVNSITPLLLQRFDWSPLKIVGFA